MLYTDLVFNMPPPVKMDPTFRWEIRNNTNGVGVHLGQFNCESDKTRVATDMDKLIPSAGTTSLPLGAHGVYVLRGVVSANICITAYF